MTNDKNLMILEKCFKDGMVNKDFESFKKTHPTLLKVILRSMQELEQKLNKHGVSGKRPDDDQINDWVQWIDKRCNFTDHQKDYVHFAIRQILKAACASGAVDTVAKRGSIIDCPNCGQEWDLIKHNACSCGAQRKIPSAGQLNKPVVSGKQPTPVVFADWIKENRWRLHLETHNWEKTFSYKEPEVKTSEELYDIFFE